MSCEGCSAIQIIKQEIKSEKSRNKITYGTSVSGNPMIHLINVSGQICNGCPNRPTLKDVLGNNHPDTIQYSG